MSKRYQLRNCSDTTENNRNNTDDLFDNMDDPNFTPTMKDMFKMMHETHKTVCFLADKFDNFTKKIEQIEQQNKIIRKENIDLKQRIKDLELNQFHHQQQQFNKHLTIHGVPMKPNEDLKNIITNITKIIKIGISSEQIKSCRRMNSNNQQNSPIIVAEFDSTEIKQDIQKHFKLNGPVMVQQLFTNTTNNSQKIYMNEYLHEYTRKLFEDTKRIKTKYNIKYVWVKNGVILIREKSDTEIIKIKHHDDIEHLESRFTTTQR